jgi:hypothetical protein
MIQGKSNQRRERTRVRSGICEAAQPLPLEAERKKMFWHSWTAVPELIWQLGR